MTSLVDAGVHMIRPTMDNPPDWALPAGYRLRAYRDGDITTWVDLHLDAERLFVVSAETFLDSFGAHLDALPGRMVFVESSDGESVGSATAWWEDDWNGRGTWGQIHWVVVATAHQRRGLSKPMVAYALRRLARDHARTMLGTNTLRPWAIKTYLDCGFVPDPAERGIESVVRGWQALQEILHHAAIDLWLNG